jgi:hypothetical protein
MNGVLSPLMTFWAATLEPRDANPKHSMPLAVGPSQACTGTLRVGPIEAGACLEAGGQGDGEGPRLRQKWCCPWSGLRRVVEEDPPAASGLASSESSTGVDEPTLHRR